MAATTKHVWETEINQLRQQGNAAFESGLVEEALFSYNRAIETASTMLNADLLQMRECFLCQSKEHASVCHEDTATLFANRAACYLEMGKYPLCVEDCDKVLEIFPLHLKCLWRRTKAAQAMGNKAGALQDALTILKVQPRNIEVQELVKVLQGTDARELGESISITDTDTNTTLPPPPVVEAFTKPPPIDTCFPSTSLSGGWIYQPSADGVHTNLVVLLPGAAPLSAITGPFHQLALSWALPQTCTLILPGPIRMRLSEAVEAATAAVSGSNAKGREGERARKEVVAEDNDDDDDVICSWSALWDAQGHLIPLTGEGSLSTLRAESLAFASKTLQLTLNAVKKHCHWKDSDITLVGFSSGGSLLLHALAEGSAAWSGVVSISGIMLPETEQVSQQQQHQRQQQQQQQQQDSNNKRERNDSVSYPFTTSVPLLLTHGTEDKQVAWEAVKGVCVRQGLSEKLHGFPKGHAMISSEAENGVMMAFFAAHLNHRSLTLETNPDWIRVA
jgi:predicted esterase